jgi:hypothetical protein
VLGLLRDFEALRIWEVLRSARTAVTVAELAQATGLELANACERVARADGRRRIVECINSGRGGPGAR